MLYWYQAAFSLSYNILIKPLCILPHELNQYDTYNSSQQKEFVLPCCIVNHNQTCFSKLMSLDSLSCSKLWIKLILLCKARMMHCTIWYTGCRQITLYQRVLPPDHSTAELHVSSCTMEHFEHQYDITQLTNDQTLEYLFLCITGLVSQKGQL